MKLTPLDINLKISQNDNKYFSLNAFFKNIPLIAAYNIAYVNLSIQFSSYHDFYFSTEKRHPFTLKYSKLVFQSLLTYRALQEEDYFNYANYPQLK